MASRWRDDADDGAPLTEKAYWISERALEACLAMARDTRCNSKSQSAIALGEKYEHSINKYLCNVMELMTFALFDCGIAVSLLMHWGGRLS